MTALRRKKYCIINYITKCILSVSHVKSLLFHHFFNPTLPIEIFLLYLVQIINQCGKIPNLSFSTSNPGSFPCLVSLYQEGI